MLYKLLAYFTILIHFVWILFIVFGFFFALIKSRIALLHLIGLFFSLVLNLMEWYCPLTYLENYLHSLHDMGSTYGGPFIIKYLEAVIYPDIPEHFIRTGGILLVIFYIIFYAYMAGKYQVFKRKLVR